MEALQIADQYMLEKDMLPDDDAEKSPVAIELIKRIIDRFKDNAQDELGELNREFTSFKMEPGEKVCTGIDRLNGIIQKLTQHNQPPTAEAKLSKLEDALNIPSLSELWLSVALKDNVTFDSLVLSCRKYDKAVEKVLKRNGEPAVLWTGEKKSEEIVCSYPACGKTGHSSKECFKRIADQKAGKAKRANRSKEKTVKVITGQKPGSKDYTGCDKCGSKEHRAFDCSKKIKVTLKKRKGKDQDKDTSNKKRKSGGINSWVRAGESDSSGEESNMICEEGDEVHLTEEDGLVFLDSCASKKLFIVRDQSCLEKFTHDISSVQTTKTGSTLETQGTGSFKDWSEVRVCNDAIKNIIGAGYLRSMGYGLSLLRVPRIVNLDSGEEVVIDVEYAANGMPFASLQNLLHLPDISQ